MRLNQIVTKYIVDDWKVKFVSFSVYVKNLNAQNL